MADVKQTAAAFEAASRPQALRTPNTVGGLGGASQTMINRSEIARPHGPKKSTQSFPSPLSMKDQTGDVSPILNRVSPGHTHNALGDC